MSPLTAEQQAPRYARPKGGHMIHLLPVDKSAALCGFEPHSRPYAKFHRAGWLIYRDQTKPPENRRPCTKCFEKQRATS